MKLIDDDPLDKALLVDGCSCSNSARSQRSKRPLSGEQRAPARVACGAACRRRAGRSARRAPPARDGARRARSRSSASRRPGESTRWISRSASSGVNQWNACPTVTASTYRSVSGMRSAVPASAATPRTRRSSSATHLAHRLDGDHVGAARYEQARQLPRPGGEVEDRASRPQVELPRRCGRSQHADSSGARARMMSAPSAKPRVARMQVRHGRQRSRS